MIEFESLSEQQIVARLLAQDWSQDACDNEGKYRKAAVLVPFLWEKNEWQVLFTRRTDSVQDHKGQVSFPGGVFEPEDPDPQSTAAREAYEEIGLPPTNIRILGLLDCYKTITNYVIWPVIARVIQWPFALNVSKEEVERVFTVPLAWLSDPTHVEERPRIKDGRMEKVVYFQEYDGELVWGVTGRITLNLIHTLGLTS